MKFSRVLLALWLAAALAEIQFGQDPAANDIATRVADGVSPLKPASLQLPDGDGAWSVRVIRTGGLMGSLLDIAVTSRGEVTCQQQVGVERRVPRLFRYPNYGPPPRSQR
jgi:hypothetical protein